MDLISRGPPEVEPSHIRGKIPGVDQRASNLQIAVVGRNQREVHRRGANNRAFGNDLVIVPGTYNVPIANCGHRQEDSYPGWSLRESGERTAPDRANHARDTNLACANYLGDRIAGLPVHLQAWCG